jgi:hypothetical protein
MTFSFDRGATPAAVPELPERILFRWRSDDGRIWRLLGGSVEDRLLFSGNSLDDRIPGLLGEIQALPPMGPLGVLRLFVWEPPLAGETTPRLSVQSLQPSGPETWRLALPLAVTPDGRRVLVAASVPGRPLITFGRGGYGVSTDLFALDGGRARRLTRLCGQVRQAALTPDGDAAAAIAGIAVTRSRGFTPVETFALDVAEAARAGGILPQPLGIQAAQRGTGQVEGEGGVEEANCSPIWPDPPQGRIAPEPLLRRFAEVAALPDLADTAAIERALRVRIGAAAGHNRSAAGQCMATTSRS